MGSRGTAETDTAVALTEGLQCGRAEFTMASLHPPAIFLGISYASYNSLTETKFSILHVLF